MYRFRSSCCRAGCVLVGLDGSEVRLSDPCALIYVRPRVPCVSRVCPGSPRCLFAGSCPGFPGASGVFLPVPPGAGAGGPTRPSQKNAVSGTIDKKAKSRVALTLLPNPAARPPISFLISPSVSSHQTPPFTRFRNHAASCHCAHDPRGRHACFKRLSAPNAHHARSSTDAGGGSKNAVAAAPAYRTRAGCSRCSWRHRALCSRNLQLASSGANYFWC